MDIESIGSNTHWIVVGIGAIGLGLIKLVGLWKSERLEGNRTDAELDVIVLLRNQVAELGAANQDLRQAIAELREVNVSLLIENGRLRAEVDSLKTTVDHLTARLEAR